MKKKLLLVVTYQFIIFNSFAQAPSWLWAKRVGGASTSGHDSGGSITMDAAGNSYISGFFAGTVDFNPGAGVFNLTAVNPNDNFVLKLDASGNFLWARKLSTFNYENIHSIAVDASGNVYTTGFFNGTVDFDPGSGVFNLTASGSSDIYIWKLNSSGNFVWAKTMGGTSNEYGYSLTLDAPGNVYVAGSFRGTVDFDPGPATFNLTATGEDIFISKLDSAGNFIWAKAASGINYEYCYGIALSPFPSTDIYITGSFTGTADFDPGVGVFNLTAAGNNDIYISKLDSSGNFIWAKAMGSSTNNDYGFSIAVDPTGVYTKGSFQGTVDFDPGAGVFNLTSTSYSGFLSKLDSSGNFIWAIALGGGSGQGRSLALDPSGNVYASGAFSGTVDFDPGAGTFYLTSTGAGDIYISKYNSAGNFVWVKTAGGQNHDVAIAIAFHPAGQVYVTGSFNSPSITFGSATLTRAGSSSFYSDAFIAKLDVATGVVLPVDLVSFNATYDRSREGVDLKWMTASEINNDYFIIERSVDGKNVEQILQVDGAGNSTSLLDYTAFDANPLPGKNYYRLVQTDFDGTISYSQMVAVNVNSEMQINTYPNPVSNSATISFSIEQSQKISINIFSMEGELVTTLADEILEGGENEFTWNASDTPAGIYFLRMETEFYSKTRKVSVIK